MKCPIIYLGRWASFLGLYLILLPCLVITVFVAESAKRAADLLKEMGGELRDDFFPESKRDCMRCLRGESFL